MLAGRPVDLKSCLAAMPLVDAGAWGACMHNKSLRRGGCSSPGPPEALRGCASLLAPLAQVARSGAMNNVVLPSASAKSNVALLCEALVHVSRDEQQ